MDANKEVVLRTGTLEDIRAFNGLVNNSGGAVFFRATFGQFNFSTMVEMSCVNLIATMEDNATCVGYLSATDSPGIGKDGAAFDLAMSQVQKHVPELSVRNTLFVNFLLLDERPDYDMETVGRDLLTSAFRQYPDMDYIAWLCPAAVKLTDWTQANFVVADSPELEEIAAAKSSLDDPIMGHRLLYTHRDGYLPKLRVRSARIEDNDDLLPILRESNPDVFNAQGGYFLADLIQQQDDNNRFFVGVSNEQPVAMCATSMDVNVGLISKVFNVDTFQDMFVAKEISPPPPPLVLGILGDVRSLDDDVLASLVKEGRCQLIDVEKMSLSTAGESKDEDVSKEQLERENAEQMHRMVRARVAEVADANRDSQPPFTLVRGYPRTDAEAAVVARSTPLFDMVIELTSAASDATTAPDEVADDAFLLGHLEATEALQSFMNIETAPDWKKVDMEDSEAEDRFSEFFRDLVLVRMNEVEGIAEREASEPPTANAFAITVMCTKDGYESRIKDVLTVAFEDHPTLDYCLFMVPNKAEQPNKLTAVMTAAKVRVGLSFDQTLYVMHRDTLLASELLTVERSLESNRAALEAFLNPLGDSSALELAVEGHKFNDVDLKDNPMIVSFEVRVEDNVVGVITTSRKSIGTDDANWLRSNFKIDKFVNFDRHRARSQAFITNFVLSPVYSRWTRFLVREVMRKYMKTVLYFQHESNVPPPQVVLDEFLPVPPRKRMEAVPGMDLPMRIRPSLGLGVDCPLFQLCKSDLTRPKRTVLNRIVIFGGGVAALGILEKLCYIPHTNFPNIYLISDIPCITFCQKGHAEDDYAKELCGLLSVQDSDAPSLTEQYAYGFAHRVNYIRGRLTDIDRSNKAVIVSDELVVEYDQLVIAGTTKDKSFKEFPSTKGMHSSYCEKRGIFGLGDVYTDRLAFNWVEKQEKPKWPIVVYGSIMSVCAAVGNLQKLGVLSRRITAVIPSDDLPENCHPNMNEAIIRNLRSSGVIIHRNHDIQDVVLSGYGTIEAIKIRNLVDAEMELNDMPCFSLLTCRHKYCDPDIFAAVNDCGIVYDGGVVVDRDFCTADANIYAVGDFSRFSRVHRSEPAHANNSALEMGHYVGTRLLALHLHCPDAALPEGEDDCAVPQFALPRTMMQTMPGGRYYFDSKMAREAEDTNVLISGDLKTDNICALKLDSFGVLIEICYVGKSPVEAKNFSKLLGMHEATLNSAMNAYENGEVEDWAEWFHGEWTMALFHDEMAAMSEAIKSNLATDKGTFTILDRVADAVESSTENDKLNEEWAELIGPHGNKLDTSTKRIVETSTVDYLRSNKVMLNRFALPQPKAKQQQAGADKKTKKAAE